MFILLAFSLSGLSSISEEMLSSPILLSGASLRPYPMASTTRPPTWRSTSSSPTTLIASRRSSWNCSTCLRMWVSDWLLNAYSAFNHLCFEWLSFLSWLIQLNYVDSFLSVPPFSGKSLLYHIESFILKTFLCNFSRANYCMD